MNHLMNIIFFLNITCQIIIGQEIWDTIKAVFLTLKILNDIIWFYSGYLSL